MTILTTKEDYQDIHTIHFLLDSNGEELMISGLNGFKKVIYSKDIIVINE